MRILNINVTKIPKDRIKSNPNWKGKYLELVCVEKKDDKWDGFIACSVSKEDRAAGIKGEIVGNWKRVGAKREEPKPAPKAESDNHPDEDDIPF